VLVQTGIERSTAESGTGNEISKSVAALWEWRPRVNWTRVPN